MSSETLAPIEGFASRPESWNPRKSNEESPFWYVDISSVDSVCKRIVEPSSIKPEDAPSRARQKLKAGDVLVSTVRPNLNAVAQVPEELDGATGSTGFSVLRPKPGKLHDRFLFYWVQTPEFVGYLLNHSTGANYPAVSDRVVRSAPIPTIHYNEQRRIAAILDKADAIRRKREQALALADDLLKSTFLEMFGDPERNPKRYAVRNFGSLLEFPLRNGISPSSRGEVDAEVLTLSAITGSSFDSSERKTGKFLVPIAQNDQVNRNDFYICRGNGSSELVGRGFFASETLKSVAFPDTMIAARPDVRELCRGFLETVWNSPFVRSQIVNSARTTNGTHKINQTATNNIAFPVPPLKEQQKYERITTKVRASTSRLTTELDGNDLFASLSQRAFRGEL